MTGTAVIYCISVNRYACFQKQILYLNNDYYYKGDMPIEIEKQVAFRKCYVSFDYTALFQRNSAMINNWNYNYLSSQLNSIDI